MRGQWQPILAPTRRSKPHAHNAHPTKRQKPSIQKTETLHPPFLIQQKRGLLVSDNASHRSCSGTKRPHAKHPLIWFSATSKGKRPPVAVRIRTLITHPHIDINMMTLRHTHIRHLRHHSFRHTRPHFDEPWLRTNRRATTCPQPLATVGDQVLPKTDILQRCLTRSTRPRSTHFVNIRKGADPSTICA